MEYLDKSVKYVNGDREAIILLHFGSSSKGMKTPLMNSKGNLTKVEIIITFEGMSVGRVDRMAAKEE